MKCPICGKATTWQGKVGDGWVLNGHPDRPFCSERCRIIDLGRWAAEEYSVSVPLKDVSEEADEQAGERNG